MCPELGEDMNGAASILRLHFDGADSPGIFSPTCFNQSICHTITEVPFEVYPRLFDRKPNAYNLLQIGVITSGARWRKASVSLGKVGTHQVLSSV